MFDSPFQRVAGWLCAASLLVLPVWSGFAASTPTIAGRVTISEREGKPKDQHDGVVVFLDALEHSPPLSPPQERAVLRQVHKRFEPAVLPIVVGTTVDFPNEDTVYHNVFSLSRTKPFDLGLYEQGGSKSVTFDQPGLVKVYCNIHPQMVAYLLVLPNPYFTMTDRTGRFVIPEAPLGAATVRAWYSRSRQSPEREVHITAQGIKDLNLTVLESLHLEIREEVLSIQHKNKWGQEYPAKY